jgi:gamma-glutamyltranspeptidase/glutathione hydrolase
MVVSTEENATRIGVEVLRKGGNAVDAAVAIGFALAVTHPAAGSLGGGGFMLIRLADGRSTFVDFRERAPGAATRGMYLDSQGNPTADSVVGYRASGVPGS